ncbi:DUF4167 domain-containing protein [Reyranella sp.]|uniref:DUF4167 domain-containing protein n=1 Tax=Reyranella sp. TaxID=1929291 RepID=UPI003BA91724
MRPNNRQRSRGGRNGGGGGGGGGNNHHHKPQNYNSNRPANRNQIFDSSGPDVRVRGNAHQVFDKYQSLAREAASSGDRILAESYWQYADHYYRMIQAQGGFVQRNNLGWGENGEEGQPDQTGQQQGQPGGQPQQTGSDHAPSNERGGRGEQPDQNQAAEGQGDGRQADHRQADNRQSENRQSDTQADNRQADRPADNRQSDRQTDRQADRQPERRQPERRQPDRRQAEQVEEEPGLNGVAFLQKGRSAPINNDPAVDEQPEVPEFVPASGGRRG